MTCRLRPVAFLMALGVAGAALTATPTLADIARSGISIVATTATGDAASFEVPVPLGVTSGSWSSNRMVEMRSPTTGDLIAVLNPDGRESHIEYIDDPTVALAFAALAGPATTTFLISSALLGFPDRRRCPRHRRNDGDRH